MNNLTAPEGWAAAAEADSSSTLGSSIKAAAKTKVKKQKQKAKVAKSSAAVKAGAKRSHTLRSGSQKGKAKQTATQSLQQKRQLPLHRAAIMVYAQVADGEVSVQMHLYEQPAAQPAQSAAHTGWYCCKHAVPILLYIQPLRNMFHLTGVWLRIPQLDCTVRCPVVMQLHDL